jgi:hypothetical protein
MGWRRRRDSNPRYALSAYNGLANRRLQPLGHVSGGRNPYRSETFASRRKRRIGQNEARITGSGRIRIRITLSTVRSSKAFDQLVGRPPVSGDCQFALIRTQPEQLFRNEGSGRITFPTCGGRPARSLRGTRSMASRLVPGSGEKVEHSAVW